MAVSIRGAGFASEAELVGLMTEGTAGIAVVVLAVLGLAKVSPEVFASIVTILIGAGLMVEAWKTAAEEAHAAASGAASDALTEIGARSVIAAMIGLTGLTLGILGLVGINPMKLIPSALIVFGGGLMLSAASALVASFSPAEGGAQARPVGATVAVGSFKAMVGLAAIVLGILALILGKSWVLPLVGFIAVGAALLLTSATFGAGVSHMVIWSRAGRRRQSSGVAAGPPAGHPGAPPPRLSGTGGLALYQSTPADGLSRADAVGAFERGQRQTRRSHRGRQRRSPSPAESRRPDVASRPESAVSCCSGKKRSPTPIREVAWKAQLRLCAEKRPFAGTRWRCEARPQADVRHPSQSPKPVRGTRLWDVAGYVTV